MKIEEIVVEPELEEDEEEESQLHTDEDFLEALELLEVCHKQIMTVLRHYKGVTDPSVELYLKNSCRDIAEFLNHYLIPNIQEEDV